MPRSECRFIKRMAEFIPKTEIRHIPANTRGIYALLKEIKKDVFDVVYIGLSAGDKAGMSSRMRAHGSKNCEDVEWTHFSIFEVHDNIYNDEIRELEGLFRHIYRKDTSANRLNKQQRYKKFKKVTTKSLQNWKQS
jgi:hypothetical protein